MYCLLGELDVVESQIQWFGLFLKTRKGLVQNHVYALTQIIL